MGVANKRRRSIAGHEDTEEEGKVPCIVGTRSSL